MKLINYLSEEADVDKDKRLEKEIEDYLIHSYLHKKRNTTLPDPLFDRMAKRLFAELNHIKKRRLKYHEYLDTKIYQYPKNIVQKAESMLKYTQNINKPKNIEVKL